jgi:hypothetical protein
MIKQLVKRSFILLGYELVKIRKDNDLLPRDFADDESEIIRRVQPFTMTTPERLYGLIKAVKYIEHNSIDGSIVECGVWRGGSMMAVAHTLNQIGNQDRDLYLFDTYEGMTAPTDKDGSPALEKFNKTRINDNSSTWCRATIDEVKKNMSTTNYNEARIHFIKGKVEETIPSKAPEKIALLRLDTDWYESTKHELEHLYPRLQQNGAVIIDDYGRWEGARKAVEEYFESSDKKVLLNRMDSSGRIGIKI